MPVLQRNALSKFLHKKTKIAAQNLNSKNGARNDIGMSAEDKLDGDNNYPLWAYMMQHVLVAKGVWNIVQGLDVCPGFMDAGSVEDVTSSSS